MTLNNFGIDMIKHLEIRKKNIFESLYDSFTETYIFKDKLISEKLFNHHIKNEKQGKTYDNTFKTNIENKFKLVVQTDFTLSNDTFFVRSVY